jgi:hypothetical protein
MTLEEKKFHAVCAAVQGLLSQHIKLEDQEYAPVYFATFLSSYNYPDDIYELVNDAYLIANEIINREKDVTV